MQVAVPLAKSLSRARFLPVGLLQQPSPSRASLRTKAAMLKLVSRSVFVKRYPTKHLPYSIPLVWGSWVIFDQVYQIPVSIAEGPLWAPLSRCLATCYPSRLHLSPATSFPTV